MCFYLRKGLFYLMKAGGMEVEETEELENRRNFVVHCINPFIAWMPGAKDGSQRRWGV